MSFRRHQTTKLHGNISTDGQKVIECCICIIIYYYPQKYTINYPVKSFQCEMLNLDYTRINNSTGE